MTGRARIPHAAADLLVAGARVPEGAPIEADAHTVRRLAAYGLVRWQDAPDADPPAPPAEALTEGGAPPADRSDVPPASRKR